MYKNVMEHVVEQKLDEIMKSYDGCKCERCRSDIAAITLNNLPPRYAVTDEGVLFTKVQCLKTRYEFEVMKQIALAMTIVRENPNHD